MTRISRPAVLRTMNLFSVRVTSFVRCACVSGFPSLFLHLPLLLPSREMWSMLFLCLDFAEKTG